jgi:hypothetical protein
MRPGSTSGYFKRQERAFFAQAGKEIVRVRVEVEVPQEVDLDKGGGKARGRDNTIPCPWSSEHTFSPPQSHHRPSDGSSTTSPLPYSPSHGLSRSGPIPVTPTSIYPVSSHGHIAQPPPDFHPPTRRHGGPGVHTPPQDMSPDLKTESQTDEYVDDPDEAWRRPMPYAERRRAGKHTKRVIVR